MNTRVVPPLIGPVIAHYYIIRRTQFEVANLENAPTWNPAAVLAYVVGAGAALMNSNDVLFSSSATVPAQPSPAAPVQCRSRHRHCWPP